jgi:glycosyltransferase involved in cell wall biosynthesis
MKICFWGNVTGSLKGNTPGGGELQIALLARALAKIGHEVVVLDNEITEKYQTEDGIKVYPIEGYNKGIRMIRTFTHRLPKLYASLRDQNADIYYCRIRDFRHIIAYAAARKVRAKFILGLASDLDAMNFGMRFNHQYRASISSLWKFSSGILIEIIYPFLLRKADIIFAQHEGQKKILQEKNIKSIVFPNLIDLTQIPVVLNPIQDDFIYVGSLDRRKGFIEFFNLVNKAPSQRFKVVGQPRDKTGHLYFEKLKSYENVTLLGRLNHSDTLLQIANSKALISTSYMEGFPNVFIEAWACGIPVYSLYVDLGTLITKEGLGEVANGDLDQLLKSIENNKCMGKFGKNAKAYVEHHHDLNANKIEEIRGIFSNLLNNIKPLKNSGAH